MALVKCPSCDANADVTANGKWAHCASCNNIFEPPQPTSSAEGGASEEGKKEETKKEETK